MKGEYWFCAIGGAMTLSFLLSFVHPSGTPRTVAKSSGVLLSGAQIPPALRKIVEQKCADCHSQRTRRPLYGRFAPASWLLEHDVAEARSHWDASRWSDYSREERMQLLSRLALRAKSASMPPVRYTLLHPGTKLEQSERVSLYEWARTERRRLRSLPSQPEKTNATVR
jgi:cytochrome c